MGGGYAVVRWLASVALVLTGAFGLAACSNDAPPSSPSPTPSQAAAIPLACIVGDAGAIFLTTDGRSWEQRASGTGATLLAADFAPDRSGFVVGFDGTILRTPDGGATWQQQTSGREGMERSLTSVACLNPEQAWAVGFGAALRTTDGGRSWERAKGFLSPGASPAGSHAIDFADASRGWAAAGWQILGTSDGGLHWTVLRQQVRSRTALSFFQVAASEGRVWIAGSITAPPLPGEVAGAVLVSSDGGRTWKRQLETTDVGIDDLYCTDDRHVWALAGDDLYRSVDGGAHWKRVRGAGGSCLAFADASTGWRVGGCGVYGTSDGGRTWKRQAVIDPEVMPYAGDVAVVP